MSNSLTKRGPACSCRQAARDPAQHLLAGQVVVGQRVAVDVLHDEQVMVGDVLDDRGCGARTRPRPWSWRTRPRGRWPAGSCPVRRSGRRRRVSDVVTRTLVLVSPPASGVTVRGPSPRHARWSRSASSNRRLAEAARHHPLVVSRRRPRPATSVPGRLILRRMLVAASHSGLDLLRFPPSVEGIARPCPNLLCSASRACATSSTKVRSTPSSSPSPTCRAGSRASGCMPSSSSTRSWSTGRRAATTCSPSTST